MAELVFGKKDESFDKYARTLSFLNTQESIDSYKAFLEKNTENLLNDNYKRVIVKGEVQSGKTNNLIYTINKFYQNGGDAILFFSGVTNKLDMQNKERIVNALNMIIGKENIHISKKFSPDAKIINNVLKKDKKIAIFSIKKTEALSSFTRAFGGSDKKTLIIIDEADNTNVSKKWQPLIDRAQDEMNTKIIEITATPYKNLYSHQSKYDKYIKFESPEKYQGIKQLMRGYKIEKSDKNDLKIVKESLLRYIVDSTAIEGEKSEFLINIHHTNDGQEQMKDTLTKFLSDIWKSSKKDNAILELFRNYDEHNPQGALKVIKDFAKYNQNSLLLLNGASKSDIAIDKKVYIGDFIMNRGVTFNNLISQVFIKKGNKLDPARLMQSSRWFGYNRPANLKVVITEDMWNAYVEILEMEKFLDNFNLSKNFNEWFEGMEFEYIDIGGKNE